MGIALKKFFQYPSPFSGNRSPAVLKVQAENDGPFIYCRGRGYFVGALRKVFSLFSERIPAGHLQSPG